ncbi:MAG: cytochrome c [Maritimibacter sp.]|nr:cytochrome c [Maritimibacter sp.]
MKRLIVLSALFLAASTGFALADADVGRSEYTVACAGCHGESGLGDGPFAGLLNIAVPGLTGLTQANDGEFPFLKTLMIVDGRTGIRGHGGPMPIWGDRYEASAVEQGDVYGAELIVRGRLLSLVEYLETIQQ